MDPFNHNSLAGLTRPPSPTHPQDPSSLSSVLHPLCLPPSHLYLLLDPLPPPKQHSSRGRTFPTWILARPGLGSLGSGMTRSNDSCLMVFRTLSACIYILFNLKYLIGKILKCKRDRKERKWTEVYLPHNKTHPLYRWGLLRTILRLISLSFPTGFCTISNLNLIIPRPSFISLPCVRVTKQIRYCWRVFFFFNVHKCYHSMFIQQSEIPGVAYFYLKR